MVVACRLSLGHWLVKVQNTHKHSGRKKGLVMEIWKSAMDLANWAKVGETHARSKPVSNSNCGLGGLTKWVTSQFWLGHFALSSASIENIELKIQGIELLGRVGFQWERGIVPCPE